MSLAINGLSHIVSPSLAADLAPDLVSKLTHSSPHVRKKAIPVLYKCFLQSPELLRTCWPRLRECLNDEDSSVVSATVNVVCELARRNPKNYLPLAPQLFKLLTDGGNNWMTIKLIKLVSATSPGPSHVGMGMLICYLCTVCNVDAFGAPAGQEAGTTNN
jgi:AP-3 complex subunit delta-1